MARRVRFTEAKAESTIRSIQRRLKRERREEKRQEKHLETLAFYRNLPLAQIHKMFDKGYSRSAIARRFGVPRHVITYAWDHRYDNTQ